MSVVTRFAPSPTWYLHIWSLRTVLFNYLFTKKNNWKFLLRIEDTDRSRLVDWSVDNMINILASVWLIADEGPNNPWDLWPYYQSERLNIYKKYIEELIEKDKAYYCFCIGLPVFSSLYISFVTLGNFFTLTYQCFRCWLDVWSNFRHILSYGKAFCQLINLLLFLQILRFLWISCRLILIFKLWYYMIVRDISYLHS